MYTTVESRHILLLKGDYLNSIVESYEKDLETNPFQSTLDFRFHVKFWIDFIVYI